MLLKPVGRFGFQWLDVSGSVTLLPGSTVKPGAAFADPASGGSKKSAAVIVKIKVRHMIFSVAFFIFVLPVLPFIKFILLFIFVILLIYSFSFTKVLHNNTFIHFFKYSFNEKI
jgi:hypothetical protein